MTNSSKKWKGKPNKSACWCTFLAPKKNHFLKFLISKIIKFPSRRKGTIVSVQLFIPVSLARWPRNPDLWERCPPSWLRQTESRKSRTGRTVARRWPRSCRRQGGGSRGSGRAQQGWEGCCAGNKCLTYSQVPNKGSKLKLSAIYVLAYFSLS